MYQPVLRRLSIAVLLCAVATSAPAQANRAQPAFDVTEATIADLQAALDLNPHFSIQYAPVASDARAALNARQ